jgi:O-antigen biosynthesis protein
MSKSTLHELYAHHTGKISDKWSLYLSEYDRLFSPMANQPVKLLEIGIQNGGSLEIWLRYFQNAKVILGCDINPDCARLSYDDKRISVVVGDANAAATQEIILKHSPQFDIIIDDGSHLSSDIAKSFALYFPYVADGGLFVAEDLHCSYWGQFEGGLFDPYSSISFFKRLADIINHEHWGVSKDRTELLRGFFREYDFRIAEETLSLVHSIEFINSMCVVRKGAARDNGLDRRVIAGTDDQIIPSNTDWHDVPYQLDPLFDESQNPWSNMPAPPDEMFTDKVQALQHKIDELNQRDDQLQALEHKIDELNRRNDQLQALEHKIDGLNERNAQLTGEISALRSSTSWRITAFPRALSGLARRLVGGREDGGIARNALGAIRVSVNKSLPGVMLGDIKNGKGARASLVSYGRKFYRQHLKQTAIGRVVGQHIVKSGLVVLPPPQGDDVLTPTSMISTASPVDALEVEARSRVAGFHLSPPLNFVVHDDLAILPRINVLLPSLRLKSMSGGPNTALLLAAMLAERGEHIRLIACDASLEGEEAALFPYMESLMRRKIARERLEIVDGFDRLSPLPIGVDDVFLATAWWTAQMARYGIAKTSFKSFIYLIQDFEPILHEGSTFQARALETYSLPHIPVINTKLLLDHLAREGAGLFSDPAFVSKALWFNPALDRKYYFPTRSNSPKKVLLFYARPSVARRNLFELGVVALRRAVASGAIDSENWEVWAMGEKLAPIELGCGVMLNPLPWMSFEDYAERIRTADLLLSLMLSPHPSYPPLEMAASGKLVVTNSFSVKTADRMRALSPNIIVAEPNAESIAHALESAAGRINCGLQSYDPLGAIDLPQDWDQSLDGVVSKLLLQLEEIREPPIEPGRPLAPGLPALPRSDYEAYRKASLSRRRKDGTYEQRNGLLSFVTSAYNTSPRFLEELGSSIFQQDGGMQFEWFILDNGSTEVGTRRALERLGRHPGVRLARVEDNLGIIGGMRFCLERATGRYILPLDSDDLIEPDCVHVLTRAILEHEYPALLFTDEDKLEGERFNTPYFKPDWDPVLFLHSCYIAHLCAIDRNLALSLGLYLEKSSEGCHDWDSFIRFMLAGKKPLHVPEVLYSWRVHQASTSGNIESKSYIAESHRNTLQRFLDRTGARDIELVNSPLFNYNVDWWFRRQRTNGQPIQTIIVGADNTQELRQAVATVGGLAPMRLETGARTIEGFSALVDTIDAPLIHVCWNDIVSEDDNWQWDAMALLELFADAVMVGGLIHDGTKIVDGPRVFGFGDGFDSPDQGRVLADPGYGAKMWKPHTVSALSSAHCVVKTAFLKECLQELCREPMSFEMLGPWLGAMALEAGKRVVYSPFMAARRTLATDQSVPESLISRWLSRFWSLIPDRRVYSPRLGLDHAKAYIEVDPIENRRHLAALHAKLLNYPEWFDMHLARRAALYPLPEKAASFTLLTTVYEGTKIELLNSLAASVMGQTVKPEQWIIVAHGPIAADDLAHIVREGAARWSANVIVEPAPLGIMSAMRLGLKHAISDYIVPLDADDLLTADAIHILTSSVARFDAPDMLFSDEDTLVEGKPTSPYLRGAFDPVLNLDSSYIWHVCAINRARALALEFYTDQGAAWCHDWDSVMRMVNGGSRIEHIAEVLYHWRQHAASTTNKPAGDTRSLDSARHVLERQISRYKMPKRFFVTNWPQNRGAPELYIARAAHELPPFVWVGDAAGDWDLQADAVLVSAASGIIIPSQEVFVEVARLMELHPSIGAVGGRVLDRDDVVIDACFMASSAGVLESPWVGRTADWSGPYALAQKSQSVATAGQSLAFFRVAALNRAGLWPLPKSEHSPELVSATCGRLAEAGWITAFSPLVVARATRTGGSGARMIRQSARMSSERQALARYGLDTGHRG